MFQTNPNYDHQGSGSDDNRLDASLLITTSPTPSSAESVRSWRLSINVVIFFISLKKTNIRSDQESSQSLTNSLLQEPLEDSNTENLPDHKSGFLGLGFVSEACNSFSRKFFKKEDASTSSYVPVPSSPAADQGLTRNLSTQSCHVIEISSESEQQEPPTRDSIVRMVAERDLNSLKKIGGVENVALILEKESHAVQDPPRTLLEAQTQKPIADMDKISLGVSIVIAVVALIRFLSRNHHGDDVDDVPELKGKVSVGMLMKILERILFKPQGKVSVLASALSVSIIAIQHGMPFVVTLSLSFWNEKVEIEPAIPRNLSAYATMGIVTLFCIDATGGLVCNGTEVDKSAVQALRNAGVRIILVSEDEVPAFTGQQVIPSLSKDILKAIIFNSFILCQVFNQFNAMGLVKQKVLVVVLTDYTFLLALGTITVIQVVVVEFVKSSLAGLERLNGVQWCFCLLLAVLSWGLHCAVNFTSDSIINWSSSSDGLQFSPYVSVTFL
ncbi:hypothetical protein Pint_01863 [Pistacia integerrima]|uniref:Uncharacterized protein n=1 Tax=Pistacia integerrima TaxID=434235 RepID=A0ACC0ZJ01_9ROSI|nr:hypothetical protein Pint_01863 [Pistacia integerrima]